MFTKSGNDSVNFLEYTFNLKNVIHDDQLCFVQKTIFNR